LPIFAEVALHLLDEVAVVSTLGVEPEHCRRAGGPGTRDGESHPIPDRLVLGLAGAPDVPGPDLVLDPHRPAGVDHLDGPGLADLERLVVAAVLLSLLRHEPDVRHRAHGGRVEGAVLTAVVE